MDSSSSFGTPSQGKYDVFLSFRGSDTRDTITSHLHAALVRKKIKTYIDNILERGDTIGPTLQEAIEKSKLSIIIFSRNYASSTWCLDELAHILSCKKRYGQMVIPVFYGIDPSHVRKQQGSFADALDQLESQNFKDVPKWRAALEDAANMSGFHISTNTGTEADFVEHVAEDVLTKFNRKGSRDLTGLVGIERRIEKLESLLCIDSPKVCAIGICGKGGIGKTTLAHAVFHKLASKFEACYFLANVREEAGKHGLQHLKHELLRALLKEIDLGIGSASIESAFIQERLRRTKVLIVLDDVDDSSQLQLLLADLVVRFRAGSRIIVTTRSRRLLRKKICANKIYQVEALNSDEALQLFRRHAFRDISPTTEHIKVSLSRDVVSYVDGNPLGVKILGSLFLHLKSNKDWEDELNKLKLMKFSIRRVQNVLRRSYDILEKNQKRIFLDIACKRKGMNVDDVKRMWTHISGNFFEDGIKALIDMSLISISEQNCLGMHDLLQQMGQGIVQPSIQDRVEASMLSICDDSWIRTLLIR